MNTKKFHGSDWIAENLKCEMSELGIQVADILGDAFFGIHRLHKSLCEVDWSNESYIEIPLGYKSLSTVDNDTLTRLVVLSHDRMLRLEISGRAYHYLTLEFHRKNARDGKLYDRCPTIEQAIEDIRADYE